MRFPAKGKSRAHTTSEPERAMSVSEGKKGKTPATDLDWFGCHPFPKLYVDYQQRDRCPLSGCHLNSWAGRSIVLSRPDHSVWASTRGCMPWTAGARLGPSAVMDVAVSVMFRGVRLGVLSHFGAALWVGFICVFVWTVLPLAFQVRSLPREPTNQPYLPPFPLGVVICSSRVGHPFASRKIDCWSARDRNLTFDSAHIRRSLLFPLQPWRGPFLLDSTLRPRVDPPPRLQEAIHEIDEVEPRSPDAFSYSPFSF
ncbi:uncharacterized protein LY79DRAFT_34141 [Colletotrichum navitas]|uniref:Uncharacterized protein n=1 Tax=Colletotrichum navitas TaxID=681940 RepID=A0AAD8V9J8_9PEZI|nr:uncharacterized protein LY79DRAFT_34141 [Colletotrichum navitas]KAK1596871.1 hypothetical protein LY79DRAFT_34141 [Colletotrichum navitas]